MLSYFRLLAQTPTLHASRPLLFPETAAPELTQHRFTTAVCVEYYHKRGYLVDEKAVSRFYREGTRYRIGDKFPRHLERIDVLDEIDPLEKLDRRTMECIVKNDSVPVERPSKIAMENVNSYIEFWIPFHSPIVNPNTGSTLLYKVLPLKPRKMKDTKNLDAEMVEPPVDPGENDDWEMVE